MARRSKDLVLDSFIIFKDKNNRMTHLVNFIIMYNNRNNLLKIVSKLTVGPWKT